MLVKNINCFRFWRPPYWISGVWVGISIRVKMKVEETHNFLTVEVSGSTSSVAPFYKNGRLCLLVTPSQEKSRKSRTTYVTGSSVRTWNWKMLVVQLIHGWDGLRLKAFIDAFQSDFVVDQWDATSILVTPKSRNLVYFEGAVFNSANGVNYGFELHELVCVENTGELWTVTALIYSSTSVSSILHRSSKSSNNWT